MYMYVPDNWELYHGDIAHNVVDKFRNSHNLSSSLCIKKVRRIEIIITPGEGGVGSKKS